MIMWLINWFRARRLARQGGAIPQDWDNRDYHYEDYFKQELARDKLKDSCDLRNYLNGVRDQKRSQACVGFASAAGIEYLINAHLKLEHVFYKWISPAFIWWNAKDLHGWPTQNKGVWLRNALKATFKKGWVYEESYPFSTKYSQAPYKATYAIGEMSKMAGFKYYLLKSSSVKHCLSDGFPVVFGLWLNKSFYNGRNGLIDSKPKINSAHAMLLCGYDDDRQVFIARNSWGTWWGDQGYCYIPYDYFMANSFDLWTVREAR